MEKPIKLRHIAKVSKLTRRFTPITETSNIHLYSILASRFESFRRWPETTKITRCEFEEELHNNPELVDVYIDIFSKQAEFFTCMVNDQDLVYEYCIMCIKKRIVLLYYRDAMIIIE